MQEKVRCSIYNSTRIGQAGGPTEETRPLPRCWRSRLGRPRRSRRWPRRTARTLPSLGPSLLLLLMLVVVSEVSEVLLVMLLVVVVLLLL